MKNFLIKFNDMQPFKSVLKTYLKTLQPKFWKSHWKIPVMENFLENLQIAILQIAILDKGLHRRFSPANFEKFFRTLSDECFCSFQAFSKQLHYFSDTLLQLPTCSPPKTVNIWHIKLMNGKLHKQLSRSVSGNIRGDVHFA